MFPVMEGRCQTKKARRPHSHQVPDDAGPVRAGRDALLVVALQPDAGDGGLVLLHGLHKLVGPRKDLPDPHLDTESTEHLAPQINLTHNLKRKHFSIFTRCAETLQYVFKLTFNC